MYRYVALSLIDSHEHMHIACSSRRWLAIAVLKNTRGRLCFGRTTELRRTEDESTIEFLSGTIATRGKLRSTALPFLHPHPRHRSSRKLNPVPALYFCLLVCASVFNSTLCISASPLTSHFATHHLRTPGLCFGPPQKIQLRDAQYQSKNQSAMDGDQDAAAAAATAAAKAAAGGAGYDGSDARAGQGWRSAPTGEAYPLSL